MTDLDHAADARPTQETNVKFQPKESYAPEPVEQTPNRKALSDLNEARAAAATEVEALQGRLTSLARLRDAVGPIESELSALDAEEADALADWSLNPDQPAPESDVATRDAIVARLTAARQRVASAEQATASVEHVLATATARAAALESQVPALVANVLVDEAHSLLPGITEATASLAKAQVRFTALRSLMLDRAEASRDAAKQSGFFQALEALDIAAREAAANAPAPDFNAPLEWRELARELGDTPARPTPAPIAAFPGMPEMKW